MKQPVVDKYSALSNSDLQVQVEDYRRQINDLNTVIGRVARLSNFFNKIETVDSVKEIFNLFIDELKSLFEIKFAGLFLLDKDELDFELFTVNPQELFKECQNLFTEDVEAGVFGWAINQSKFSVLPDKNDLDKLTVVFPLKRNRRIFGAVIVKMAADKDFLNSEQQSYLSVFFKQLTMALGNAVYLEEINKQKNELEKYRKRIEAEMLSAKKIQENIIPKKFPMISTTFFNAVYQPYEKIGGDFYDVLKINDRHFVAVIADVSGHGVPAALGTAAIKTAVYGSVHPLRYNFMNTVGDIVRNLQVMFSDEQYATMFIGDFDLVNRKITYCSFGHMPVIQHNRSTNHITLLEANNLFVNCWEIDKLISATAKIGETDTFLLFTDGIIECVDNSGEMYGLDRLKDLVKSSSKEHLIKAVLKQNTQFCQQQVADDDIAVLQISMNNLL